MSKRQLPHWEHERLVYTEGLVPVAGVDEAGRGPLAGPVVAAAVVLPPELELPGLADSKQLAAEQREELFVLITEGAVAVGVSCVGHERIDTVNILRATHEAMAEALATLPARAAFALVDGLPVTGLPCPHRALVAGDAACVSIAAAAIVAKVVRDRFMRTLEGRFPGYNFARNKGYPTPDHLEALRRLGPCPVHRRTFRPVAECEAPSARLSASRAQGAEHKAQSSDVGPSA
jgi:ribonuclease HII